MLYEVITRIDISHVGVFRALVKAASLSDELETRILQLLQAKDVPGLTDCCAAVAEPYRSALLRLPGTVLGWVLSNWF